MPASRLLAALVALATLPARAADDPWAAGCPNCTVIDPPAYMAAAMVRGLLRCRDKDATAAAAAILLGNALDLSTPEKLAAFEATHVSGDLLPPDIEIVTLCETVGGSRTIHPADGGTREAMTILVQAE